MILISFNISSYINTDSVYYIYFFTIISIVALVQ